MKKFLIVIVLGILTSCDSNQKNIEIYRGKVIIAGNIELSDSYSKVISLSYPCSVNRCDYQTEIIDSTGNFKFEIEILHPQDVLLKYEKGFAQLFVKPLDSLNLSLNSISFKKEKFPEFKISGNNSETSQNILDFLRFKNIDDFHPKSENKSVEEYLMDIKHRMFIEDSILSEFRKSYNPTKEFLTWAKKDIIYRNANYLIDFKFHHFMNKTQYKGELFDKSLFPVNDESAIISSSYGIHIWHYSTDKYIQKDSVIMNLLKEQKLSQAYEICLKNIVEYEQSGISRDIMCYRIISKFFEDSFEDFSELRKDVNLYLNNNLLITLLQKRKEEFEKQNNYHVSLLDPVTEEEKEIIGDFFSNLTDKHKGKVIYLDIGATWCGPCKSEIPYSIELHDYYKNKPIVFVNLCMSSDRNEWKKAIENLHIAGENYYLDKAQSQLLRNKLKWKGFPTYIIIDKKGNIVDDDAPRPSSDSRIKMRLNELIDK